MTQLETALSGASAMIAGFLERDKPQLDALFAALAQVEPLLPVPAPNPSEKQALADYRELLEQLQPALQRLAGHLWSQRTILLEQSNRLKVLRSYTSPA